MYPGSIKEKCLAFELPWIYNSSLTICVHFALYVPQAVIMSGLTVAFNNAWV